MPHSPISEASLGHGPRTHAVDVVGAAVLTLSGPLLLWAGRVLLAADPTTAPAALLRALGLAASAAGVALLAWWCLGALGLALMVLGRALRQDAWIRVGARLAPGVLRRTGAAVLGLQLLAAPTAWAQGAPEGPGSPSAVAAAPVDASWLAPADTSPASAPSSRPAATPGPAADPVDAAAVPDTAWTPVSPAPPPPGAAARPRPVLGRDTVTVRDGDCLWDIAAAELGPDATPRQIDRRWRDWHRENRGVIGEDPSLLHTGTVLVVPVFSPHAPPEEAATR